MDTYIEKLIEQYHYINSIDKNNLVDITISNDTVELLKAQAVFKCDDAANQAIVVCLRESEHKVIIDDSEAIVDEYAMLYLCDDIAKDEHVRLHHIEKNTFSKCVFAAAQTAVCDHYEAWPEITVNFV